MTQAGTIYVDLMMRKQQYDREADAARRTAQNLEKMAIAPKVNAKELHDLNRLYDQKIAHHKEVANFVKTNPIVPAVDTRSLSAGINQVRTFSAEVSRVRSQMGAIGVDMGTTISQRVTVDFGRLDSRMSYEIRSLRNDLSKDFGRVVDAIAGLKPSLLSRVASFGFKAVTAPLQFAGGVAGSALNNIFTGFTEDIGKTLFRDTAQKSTLNFSRQVKKFYSILDEEIVGRDKAYATFFAEFFRSGSIEKAFGRAIPRTEAGKIYERLMKLQDIVTAPSQKKGIALINKDPELKEIFKQSGGDFKRFLELAQPTALTEKIVNPIIEEFQPLLRFIQDIRAARTATESQKFYNERKAAFPILDAYSSLVNVSGGAQFKGGQGGRSVAMGLEMLAPNAYFMPVENPDSDSNSGKSNALETWFKDAIFSAIPGISGEFLNTAVNAFRQVTSSINPFGYSTAAAQGIANTRLAQEQGVSGSFTSFSLGGMDSIAYANTQAYMGLNSKSLGMNYPFVNLAGRVPQGFNAGVGIEDPLSFPLMMGLGFNQGGLYQQTAKGKSVSTDAHHYKHLLKNTEFLQLFFRTIGQDIPNISKQDITKIVEAGEKLYEIIGAAEQMKSLATTGAFNNDSPFNNFVMGAENTQDINAEQVMAKFFEWNKAITQLTAADNPEIKKTGESLKQYFEDIQELVFAKLREINYNLPSDLSEMVGYQKFQSDAGMINRWTEEMLAGINPRQTMEVLPAWADEIQNQTIPWFNKTQQKNLFGEEYVKKITEAYKQFILVLKEFVRTGGQIDASFAENINIPKPDSYTPEIEDFLFNQKLRPGDLPKQEVARVTELGVPKPFEQKQSAILGFNQLQKVIPETLPNINQIQGIGVGMSGAITLLGQDLTYKTDLDPEGLSKVASDNEIAAYETLQGRLSPLLYQAKPGQALVTERIKGRPLKEILDRIAQPYKKLQEQQSNLEKQIAESQDPQQIQRLGQELDVVRAKAKRESQRFNKAAEILYKQVGQLGAALQQMGVVHNDIASGNVFFTQDGPVAIDLGNSDVIQPGQTTLTPMQKFGDFATAIQRSLIDRDYFGLLNPFTAAGAVVSGYKNPLAIPQPRQIDESLLTPAEKAESIPLGTDLPSLLFRIVDPPKFETTPVPDPWEDTYNPEPIPDPWSTEKQKSVNISKSSKYTESEMVVAGTNDVSTTSPAGVLNLPNQDDIRTAVQVGVWETITAVKRTYQALADAENDVLRRMPKGEAIATAIKTVVPTSIVAGGLASAGIMDDYVFALQNLFNALYSTIGDSALDVFEANVQADLSTLLQGLYDVADSAIKTDRTGFASAITNQIGESQLGVLRGFLNYVKGLGDGAGETLMTAARAAEQLISKIAGQLTGDVAAAGSLYTAGQFAKNLAGEAVNYADTNQIILPSNDTDPLVGSASAGIYGKIYQTTMSEYNQRQALLNEDENISAENLVNMLAQNRIARIGLTDIIRNAGQDKNLIPDVSNVEGQTRTGDDALQVMRRSLGSFDTQFIKIMQELIAQAKESGKEIPAGLEEGIKQYSGRMEATAKQELALNLVRMIKAVFGIASPSKVFIEIGKNIVLGYEAGITGAAKNLKLMKLPAPEVEALGYAPELDEQRIREIKEIWEGKGSEQDKMSASAANLADPIYGWYVRTQSDHDVLTGIANEGYWPQNHTMRLLTYEDQYRPHSAKSRDAVYGAWIRTNSDEANSSWWKSYGDAILVPEFSTENMLVHPGDSGSEESYVPVPANYRNLQLAKRHQYLNEYDYTEGILFDRLKIKEVFIDPTELTKFEQRTADDLAKLGIKVSIKGVGEIHSDVSPDYNLIRQKDVEHQSKMMQTFYAHKPTPVEKVDPELFGGAWISPHFRELKATLDAYSPIHPQKVYNRGTFHYRYNSENKKIEPTGITDEQFYEQMANSAAREIPDFNKKYISAINPSFETVKDRAYSYAKDVIGFRQRNRSHYLKKYSGNVSADSLAKEYDQFKMPDVFLENMNIGKYKNLDKADIVFGNKANNASTHEELRNLIYTSFRGNMDYGADINAIEKMALDFQKAFKNAVFTIKETFDSSFNKLDFADATKKFIKTGNPLDLPRDIYFDIANRQETFSKVANRPKGSFRATSALYGSYMGDDYKFDNVEIVDELNRRFKKAGKFIGAGLGLGENMTDGAKKGADFDSVGKFFVDGFKGLVTKIKRFLRISSPSQVFVEIGDNIIAGLIIGIDGRIKEVQQLDIPLPELQESGWSSFEDYSQTIANTTGLTTELQEEITKLYARMTLGLGTIDSMSRQLTLLQSEYGLLSLATGNPDLNQFGDDTVIGDLSQYDVPQEELQSINRQAILSSQLQMDDGIPMPTTGTVQDAINLQEQYLQPVTGVIGPVIEAIANQVAGIDEVRNAGVTTSSSMSLGQAQELYDMGMSRDLSLLTEQGEDFVRVWVRIGQRSALAYDVAFNGQIRKGGLYSTITNEAVAASEAIINIFRSITPEVYNALQGVVSEDFGRMKSVMAFFGGQNTDRMPFDPVTNVPQIAPAREYAGLLPSSSMGEPLFIPNVVEPELGEPLYIPQLVDFSQPYQTPYDNLTASEVPINVAPITEVAQSPNSIPLPELMPIASQLPDPIPLPDLILLPDSIPLPELMPIASQSTQSIPLLNSLNQLDNIFNSVLDGIGTFQEYQANVAQLPDPILLPGLSSTIPNQGTYNSSSSGFGEEAFIDEAAVPVTPPGGGGSFTGFSATSFEQILRRMLDGLADFSGFTADDFAGFSVTSTIQSIRTRLSDAYEQLISGVSTAANQVHSVFSSFASSIRRRVNNIPAIEADVEVLGPEPPGRYDPDWGTYNSSASGAGMGPVIDVTAVPVTPGAGGSGGGSGITLHSVYVGGGFGRGSGGSSSLVPSLPPPNPPRPPRPPQPPTPFPPPSNPVLGALPPADTPSGNRLFVKLTNFLINRVNDVLPSQINSAFDAIEDVLDNITSAANEAGEGIHGLGRIIDAIGQRDPRLRRMITTLKDIGVGVLFALGLGQVEDVLVDFGRASVQAALRVEKFKVALAYGDGSALSGLQRIRDLSSEIGANFLTTAESFSKMTIAAAGTDIAPQIEDITKGFAIALTAQGASPEEQGRAFLAVQQMIGKGQIMSEELRQQLAEVMPQVTGALARSKGMTQQQLVNEMNTTALAPEEDLLPLARQLQAEASLSMDKYRESPLFKLANIQNKTQEIQASFGNTLLNFPLALDTANVAVTGLSKVMGVLGTTVGATAAVIGIRAVAGLATFGAKTRLVTTLMRAMGLEFLFVSHQQNDWIRNSIQSMPVWARGTASAIASVGLALRALLVQFGPLLAVTSGIVVLQKAWERYNNEIKKTADSARKSRIELEEFVKAEEKRESGKSNEREIGKDEEGKWNLGNALQDWIWNEPVKRLLAEEENLRNKRESQKGGNEILGTINDAENYLNSDRGIARINKIQELQKQLLTINKQLQSREVIGDTNKFYQLSQQKADVNADLAQQKSILGGFAASVTEQQERLQKFIDDARNNPEVDENVLADLETAYKYGNQVLEEINDAIAGIDREARQIQAELKRIAINTQNAVAANANLTTDRNISAELLLRSDSIDELGFEIVKLQNAFSQIARDAEIAESAFLETFQAIANIDLNFDDKLQAVFTDNPTLNPEGLDPTRDNLDRILANLSPEVLDDVLKEEAGSNAKLISNIRQLVVAREQMKEAQLKVLEAERDHLKTVQDTYEKFRQSENQILLSRSQTATNQAYLSEQIGRPQKDLAEANLAVLKAQNDLEAANKRAQNSSPGQQQAATQEVVEAQKALSEAEIALKNSQEQLVDSLSSQTSAIEEYNQQVYDSQMQFSREIRDAQWEVEDSYLNMIRQTKDLKRSWNDLVRGLDDKLLEAQNALESSRENLESIQRRIAIESSSQFDENYGRKAMSILSDYLDGVGQSRSQARELEVEQRAAATEYVTTLNSINDEVKKQLEAERERTRTLIKLGETQAQLVESMQNSIVDLTKRREGISDQGRENFPGDNNLSTLPPPPSLPAGVGSVLNQGTAKAAESLIDPVFVPSPNDVTPQGVIQSGVGRVTENYITNTNRKQHYGADRGNRRHAGIDLDVSGNQEAQSFIGGVVTRVVIDPEGRKGGYYNYVDIYNAQLNIVERIAEVAQLFVKVGQVIKPGGVIGQGEHKTGVFHYEYQPPDAQNKGKFGYKTSINPLELWKQLGIAKLVNNTQIKIIGGLGYQTDGKSINTFRANPLLEQPAQKQQSKENIQSSIQLNDFYRLSPSKKRKAFDPYAYNNGERTELDDLIASAGLHFGILSKENIQSSIQLNDFHRLSPSKKRKAFDPYAYNNGERTELDDLIASAGLHFGILSGEQTVATFAQAAPASSPPLRPPYRKTYEPQYQPPISVNQQVQNAANQASQQRVNPVQTQQAEKRTIEFIEKEVQKTTIQPVKETPPATPAEDIAPIEVPTRQEIQGAVGKATTINDLKQENISVKSQTIDAELTLKTRTFKNQMDNLLYEIKAQITENEGTIADEAKKIQELAINAKGFATDAETVKMEVNAVRQSFEEIERSGLQRSMAFERQLENVEASLAKMRQQAKEGINLDTGERLTQNEINLVNEKIDALQQELGTLQQQKNQLDANTKSMLDYKDATVLMTQATSTNRLELERTLAEASARFQTGTYFGVGLGSFINMAPILAAFEEADRAMEKATDKEQQRKVNVANTNKAIIEAIPALQKFGEELSNIAFEGKSVGDAMKGLADVILKELHDALVVKPLQNFVAQGVGALLKGVQGMFTGGKETVETETSGNGWIKSVLLPGAQLIAGTVAGSFSGSGSNLSIDDVPSYSNLGFNKEFASQALAQNAEITTGRYITNNIPGFDFGKFNPITNNAKGGFIAEAMKRERIESGGKQPVLAVVNTDEYIVSANEASEYLNYRNWKNIKSNDVKVKNFASGGFVDGRTISVNNSQTSNTKTGSTNNFYNNTVIKVQSPNDIGMSAKQIDRQRRLNAGRFAL